MWNHDRVLGSTTMAINCYLNVSNKYVVHLKHNISLSFSYNGWDRFTAKYKSNDEIFQYNNQLKQPNKTTIN